MYTLHFATEFIDCKVVLFGKPVITNDLVVSVLTSLRLIFLKFEPYHLGDTYDIYFFQISYKFLAILVSVFIKTEIVSLFEIIVRIVIFILLVICVQVHLKYNNFQKLKRIAHFLLLFFDVCLKPEKQYLRVFPVFPIKFVLYI